MLILAWLATASHAQCSFGTWNTTECCDLDGIQCEVIDGDVVYVSLDAAAEQQHRVLGRLELLPRLEWLDLSWGGWQGDIHTRFVNATWNHLSTLDLSYNDLEGDLYVSELLRSMPQLRVVDATGNALRWVDFRGGFNLSELYLGENALVGWDTPCDLTSIAVLDVAYNAALWNVELPACLPETVVVLRLSYTGLRVGSWLGALGGLTELEISGTTWVGDRSWAWVETLTRLEVFSCAGLGLSGSLTSLRGLTRLVYLAAEQNLLEGDLDALGSMPLLEHASLYANFLEGTLAPLRSLSRLRVVYLADNRLEGSLEGLSGSAPTLQQVYLSDNELNGTLDILAPSAELFLLYASRNRFEGTLDALSPLTRLVYVILEENTLTGDLRAVSNWTRLASLVLTANRLHGTLDPLRDVVASYHGLEDLYLGDNELEGTLEPLRNATHLMWISLPRNRLSGTLTPLSASSQLTLLHLEENRLSGDLEALRRLERLVDVHVFQNQLRGDVSVLSTCCPELKQVYAGDNGFEGELGSTPWPTTLTHLYLENNLLSGDVAVFQGMTRAVALDLSGNRLYGELAAFAAMTKLRKLHLGGEATAVRASDGLRPLVNHSNLTSLDLRHIGFEGSIEHVTAMLQGAFPRLAQLDLSSTPLQLADDVRLALGASVQIFNLSSLHASHEAARLASLELYPHPSVIDLTGNPFACPYPSIASSESVVLKDPCRISWASFYVSLAITCALCVGVKVGLASKHASSSAPSPESPVTSNVFTRCRDSGLRHVAPFVGKQLFRAADMVTDVWMALSMIGFIRTSEVQCSRLNSVWVPYFVFSQADDLARFDPASFATFGEWIAALQSEFVDSVVEREKYEYAHRVCNPSIFYGCSVQHPERTECVTDPEYAPRFATFEFLVWAMLAVNLCKELVKAGFAMVYLLRRKLPGDGARWVCLQSPLILLGVCIHRETQEMTLYRPTRRDLLWELVYEGLLENLFALGLGLYYSIYVTNVGLTTIDLISLNLSCTRLFALCLTICTLKT
jgi:Leucine-rich repeat (LRR) protein